MKRSYLIQRLEKPIKSDGSLLSKISNAFSFGGGLVNGGFSKEAMNILNSIFSFDYMGSAEFEYGAVPKALSKIFEDKTIVAKEITVGYKYKDWKSRKELAGSNTVFIICPKEDLKEVCKRIQVYGNREYRRDTEYDTKERVCLDEALAKGSESRTCGWLELDNGYFFFTDKEMFENVCKLFGIKE